MPVYRVCVAYLLREHEGRRQVLLGRKKRGLGTGHWVGLGGKLEPGEGVQEAVVREIAEESGVEVLASDLDRRGDLLYLFPHRESWSQRSKWPRLSSTRACRWACGPNAPPL